MMSKLRRALHLVAFSTGLLFIVSQISSPTFAQPVKSLRLGTNLAEVSDYSPQLPFVNIFVSSRTWITQCEPGIDPGCTPESAFDTNEAGSIDLDEDGWVRSLPLASAPAIFTSVATVWDLPESFAPAQYVVLYDGQGTIEYRLGALKNTASSRPGRDIITIDPSQGPAVLRISATDPARNGNYIRNIRVAAERHEALLETTRFSPDFVEQLTPYQALRFMDWMRTNNSIVSGWQSRARPSDSRYSTVQGVPPEVMIDLANTTDKAPWFTMPHRATDSYVQSFAELTKARLSDSLPIVVEYSNEVWNSAFEQGSWVELQGGSAWPQSPESGFTKRINFYGRRSAEVCDIWRRVFSDQPSRVACVISSQAANSWTASEALSCPLWVEGPCVDHGIKALAIAPYMGDYLGQPDNYREVLTWTSAADRGADQLFEELNSGAVLSTGPSGGAHAQAVQWIRDNKQVANQHNVMLVAYEGGQHLVGVGDASSTDELTGLFSTANRDSRMGSLYSRYLASWESEGGALFMHYTDTGSYTRFGSWGALELVGQVTSPKYDALRSYVGLVPNVPGGSATPTPRPSARTAAVVVRRLGAGLITSRVGGIRCGAVCSKRVPIGTQVRLRAQPARGFKLVRWKGACNHTKKVCQLLMDGDRRVRVHFTARKP